MIFPSTYWGTRNPCNFLRISDLYHEWVSQPSQLWISRKCIKRTCNSLSYREEEDSSREFFFRCLPSFCFCGIDNHISFQRRLIDWKINQIKKILNDNFVTIIHFYWNFFSYLTIWYTVNRVFTKYIEMVVHERIQISIEICSKRFFCWRCYFSLFLSILYV